MPGQWDPLSYLLQQCWHAPFPSCSPASSLFFSPNHPETFFPRFARIFLGESRITNYSHPPTFLRGSTHSLTLFLVISGLWLWPLNKSSVSFMGLIASVKVLYSSMAQAHHVLPQMSRHSGRLLLTCGQFTEENSAIFAVWRTTVPTKES